jgi:hypothetical protein
MPYGNNQFAVLPIEGSWDMYSDTLEMSGFVNPGNNVGSAVLSAGSYAIVIFTNQVLSTAYQTYGYYEIQLDSPDGATLSTVTPSWSPLTAPVPDELFSQQGLISGNGSFVSWPARNVWAPYSSMLAHGSVATNSSVVFTTPQYVLGQAYQGIYRIRLDASPSGYTAPVTFTFNSYASSESYYQGQFTEFKIMVQGDGTNNWSSYSGGNFVITHAVTPTGVTLDLTLPGPNEEIIYDCIVRNGGPTSPIVLRSIRYTRPTV